MNDAAEPLRPRDPASRADRRASRSSIRAHQVRNPVMFVVEIGALITTIGWLIQAFGGAPLGGGDEPAWFSFTVAHLAVAHGRVREPGRGAGRGPRQGPGQGAARDAHGDRGAPARRRREARLRAAPRRRRGGRGGRADPGRRHGDRGHRLGGRVRHHGRVRAGDPRVRRRPQRGDRRHARALRPHRGRDHAGAGRELPRPHDRAGRGRRAAQDAERDRARHPARGPDADLPGGGRDPAAVRRVRGHLRVGRHPDRAARVADPDHDRRAAVGDRDRRHGPARAPQRAGAVRPLGGGLGRRGRAAARQDRHDHARQPPGHRVPPDAGRRGRGAGRGRPDGVAGRRDARGPLDRGAGQAVRAPRAPLRPVRARSCPSAPRPA